MTRQSNKKAVVLFSGGVDSTYITSKLTTDFDELHLITYCVPGMIKVERSKISAEQLIQLYGNQVTHEIIDIKEYVTAFRGGISTCIKDNFKYHFFYSWCLGCKAAMHDYTARYCLDNEIKYIFDGSNAYDIHALEQHSDVKNMLNSLIYKKRGLIFESPNYYEESIECKDTWSENLLRHLAIRKDSHNLRVQYLEDLGISLGSNLGHQFRKCQPTCTVSVMFNIPRLGYKLIFKEKREGYLQYVNAKLDQHSALFPKYTYS